MARSGIAFFVSLSPEFDDDDDLSVAAAALASSSAPSQPSSSASHGVSLLTAGAEHMLLKASGDGSTIVADKVPFPEVAVPVPQAVRIPHPPRAPPLWHLLRRRDHAAAKRVKKLEKRLQVLLVDSLRRRTSCARAGSSRPKGELRRLPVPAQGAQGFAVLLWDLSGSSAPLHRRHGGVRHGVRLRRRLLGLGGQRAAQVR